MQVSSVKNKLHQLKNLQDFNLAIVIKMEFVFGVCGVCGVGFLITPPFFDGNQETHLENKKLFSCFLKVSYLQIQTQVQRVQDSDFSD